MREIGGDFPFPFGSMVRRGKAHRLLPKGADSVLLASGRDALHWIIQALGLIRGDRVLLPAYLCEDVVGPFRSHGLDVNYYAITPDLQVDSEDLVSKLSTDTKVLLYIHYFGFPLELPANVTERVGPGCCVVEDASHAFLSSLEGLTARKDITFASYRKLLPVVDGARVSWDSSWEGAGPDGLGLGVTRMSGRYLASIACRGAGGMLKALWLRLPGICPKGAFRRLFSLSDRLLDSYPKPAGMSLVSKRILRRADLEHVITSRRRNFQSLLAGLSDSEEVRPMYPELPEGVCPLGFPVLAHDRDALAGHLIQHRVYPPVHWALPAEVDREEFDDAWSVSAHILTIPIDQRYGEQEMAYILDVLHSYQPARELWPAGR